MTRIYYTVNSGLYFLNDNNGVFIDGIHGGADVGFSPVDPAVVKECVERKDGLRNLKALLFTHCHSDHYDRKTVSDIVSRTGLLLFCPGCEPDSSFTKMITEDVIRLGIGDFEIFAIRTAHDGRRPICTEPHVSFVINTPEDTFFAAGDAVFFEKNAMTVKEFSRHGIKAAFINPYQIIVESSLHFLKTIAPESIVLIHLPLKKDDTFNARLLYETAIKKYPEGMPPLIRPRFYDFCCNESAGHIR